MDVATPTQSERSAQEDSAPNSIQGERRVFILAPTGNDGPLAARVLVAAGIQVHVCHDVIEVCEGVNGQCAAVLIAEETLKSSSVPVLLQALAKQPAWLDIPVIIITSGGGADQNRLSRLAIFGPSSNVVLLERPFRPGTLVSTVESALRARMRQYLVRDLLQSVRSSEERYHHILESIGDAFIAISKEWRITYVNSSYLRFVSPLGLSLGDLMEKDFWKVFPDVAAGESGIRYRRSMEDQKPDFFEQYYRPMNAWLDVRIFPSPETLTIYLRDITDRKRQEEEVASLSSRIHEQARAFDATLSHITDFAYTFDRDCRFTYANKPLLDLWGLTLDQAVGKNFSDLNYPADLAARLHGQIQEVFRTGKTVKDDTPYTNPAGATGYYEYIFNPIFSGNGAVEAVAGSTRDISERKRTEERLRHSEAQVSEIINNSPVGVYLVDSGMRIQQINRKAQPVFGQLAGLIGRPFEEVMRVLWSPKVATEIAARFRHTLATGESYIDSSFAEDRQDRPGREYYDWQIHRMILPDGSFSVVCYFIDISAHVAAQQKIRDAIDRRDLAIAAANLGDFDWDASNDLIAISPRAAEIFGIPSTPELTRSRMRSMLHEDDAERALVALQKSIETRTDYNLEYRVNRPDGRQKWVATKGRGIYSADGSPLGMVGVIQDITQRKHEETLRSAQIHVLQLIAADKALSNVLDALIETMERVSTGPMVACVMLADPDGGHLRLGAGGRVPAELMQALNGIPVGPQSASCGAAAYSKRPLYVSDIATDRRWTQFKDLALAHGLRACWSTPIVGGNDKLLGVFDIYFSEAREPQSIDIDAVETATRTAAVAIERKRTAAVLSAHARRTGMLSETAAQLLMTEAPRLLLGDIFSRFARELDADIYLLHMAAAGPSLFTLENSRGLTRDQQKQFSSIAPVGGSLGGVTLGRKSANLSDLHGSDVGELAVLRDSGARAYTSQPLQANRRLLGMVSFASTSREQFSNEDLRFINTLCDLVAASIERTRLLGEVSSALDAAEQANRAKDDFLAALSHELRTPLNPVLLLATEAAANESISPDLREDFDTIAKNVMLEARLIDDLLDVTRITRGKLVLDSRLVAVHPILNDAISNVRAEVVQKQLNLALNFCEANPIVEGDAVRLQQVFWNVLKNAVKFTDEQGTITVRTRIASQHGPLQIEISDSGSGMTADELSRIFDAFAQGDHARKGSSHRFGGLGLGLAISRTLLELHSGSIKASSPGPGFGSLFVIELPLAPGPGQHP